VCSFCKKDLKITQEERIEKITMSVENTHMFDEKELQQAFQAHVTEKTSEQNPKEVPSMETDHDHIHSEKIQEIATQMKKSSLDYGEKREFFFEKYPEFAEKYPSLFEMCCDDEFDVQQLRFMLDLRDRVQKNHMSQHDASVKVGQTLVDKYVIDKTQ
jgi:hypothetical protein